MNRFGRVLETVTSVAPLGLRFWDPVTRSIVSDGLKVRAYPPGKEWHAVPVTTNRSGIYVLQDMPGLREAENGSGDAGYWSGVQKKAAIVEVQDDLRRFLPFTIEMQLPERGIYNPSCLRNDSKPDALDAVPLHSAPSRVAPGGMAVLRAQLWDMVHSCPAAWAYMEVRTVRSPAGKLLAMGYADDRGQIALYFGYPETAEAGGPGSPLGSPPSGQKRPLWEQQWVVQVAARYAYRDPPPTIPDLCQVHAQPIADLWADTMLGTQLSTLTIFFGKELVLRTFREETGTLLVRPAGG